MSSRTVDPEKSAFVVIMQRVHERDVSGHILASNLGYQHLMLPMEFEPTRCCYTAVPRGRPCRGRYIGSRQIWLPHNWVPAAPGEEILLPEFEAADEQIVYRQDRRTQPGELLFPERFTPKVLARDKRAMGVYAVAGQFQQSPAPRGGGMFQRHWFGVPVKAVPAGCKWVRHWDLAATRRNPSSRGARTAGVLLGRAEDGRYYIADVTRLAEDGDVVRRIIRQRAAEDQIKYGRVEISLPQDPGQAGKIQAHDFKTALDGYIVHTEPETGDKTTRAEPIAAQAEAGNVRMLEGGWIPEFLDEVSRFPTSPQKDQVDALAGAYGRLSMAPDMRAFTGELRGLF
jgi:predicted phage terminase large subunit-like protein